MCALASMTGVPHTLLASNQSGFAIGTVKKGDLGQNGIINYNND